MVKINLYLRWSIKVGTVHLPTADIFSSGPHNLTQDDGFCFVKALKHDTAFRAILVLLSPLSPLTNGEI